MKKLSLILLFCFFIISLLFGCTSQSSIQSNKDQILFTDNLTNEQSTQINTFGNFEYKILSELQNKCDLNKFKIIIFNGKTTLDPTCISEFMQNKGKVIIIQTSGMYLTTDYYNNKIVNYPAETKGFISCFTLPEQKNICENDSKEEISGTLYFQVVEHAIKTQDSYEIDSLNVLPVQIGSQGKSLAYIKNNSSPQTYPGIIENNNGLYFNYDPFKTPELLEHALIYLNNKS